MIRALLDENVPVQLRRALPGISCRTLGELGWRGMKNGELLRRADGLFDVLITADRNLYAQQNLTGRSFAIIVLPANRKREVLGLAPVILSALGQVRPGTYIRVHRSGLISIGAG